MQGLRIKLIKEVKDKYVMRKEVNSTMSIEEW